METSWHRKVGTSSIITGIDHIDRNPGNNALENLREASRLGNLANRGPNVNNMIGVKGVRKRSGRFSAQITVNRVNKHLGTFDTPEEASGAYSAAARENFGEFANEK